MLYLRFFDAFSAIFNNVQTINFRSQKIKALLAYLAVEAGRVHQRDTLTDLLWSEQSTTKAKENFRQSLSRLQKTISNQQAVPPYLMITRHTVQWDIESGYWLDVNTFLQATENALSQIDLSQIKLSTAYDQLETASKLYRGDFLAGFFVADAPEFENWAAATREQFHQQMLRSLAHVAQRAEEAGHYEQALKFAQRQIELNPWNEPAHRCTMRVLAATGQRVEAVAQFDRCVKILAEELAVDPSQETTKLHQQIVDGLYAPVVEGEITLAAHRLEQGSAPSATAKQYYQPPLRTTHFIGRAKEVDEIIARLDEPETRLVTLTGPGGVGKTSLAQEIARTLCDKYANGAAFVPMAGIDRELEIVPAILQALALPIPDKADPTASLLTYLKPLEMLLVLDNSEQFLSTQDRNRPFDFVQHLLITILEQAPQIKLLITSRIRLNLGPEWVYALDGMALPPAVDPVSQGFSNLKLAQVEQSSAVDLFVHNAQQAHAPFSLTENNMQAVAQICHTLGGLPLGLELAAGWVRILSCQEIYVEIQENLDFLEATSPDVPARHRTIQAVFDSSWQRLSPGAQEVVQRLSIFRGNYDRPAATVIANASLKALAELIDHSFVRRAGGGGGQYEMHELTRQIAAERLAENYQLKEETERTHALYFARYLEERADTLYGPKTVQNLMDIDQRFGDICLAWDYLVREVQLEQIGNILDVLYTYCRTRGKFLQGIELLEKALDLLAVGKNQSEMQSLLQAQLLSRQAILYCAIGKQEQAQICVYKAQHIAECHLPTQDKGRPSQGSRSAEAAVAFCLYVRLYIPSATRDMAEVDNMYNRGVALYQQANIPIGIAVMHNMRGVASHIQGRMREAHRFYQMSYEIALSLEYYQLLSTTLQNLGKISQDLGNYDESMDYLKQSLHYQYALNDEEGVAYVSRNMARVEMFWGNYETAFTLGQKALEIFQSINFQRGVAFTLQLLGEVSYLQDRLDDAESYLEQGMAVCDTFDNKVEATEITLTQGSLALAKQDVKRAQAFAKSAFTLAQQVQSQAFEGLAYILLGEVALIQGDYTQAQAKFEQALGAGRACDMPLIGLKAQVGLATLAIEKGAVAHGEQLLQAVLGHRAVTYELRERCEALSLKMTR